MISPGVQKPHCTAPASTNACCTSVGRPGRREPLDGDDRLADGGRREHEARAHQSPVDEHGARAALALLARALGSHADRAARAARRAGSPRPRRRATSWSTPLTCRRVVLAHRPPPGNARSSSRSASTPTAWRRYAAVERWSSIGRLAAAASAAELASRRRRPRSAPSQSTASTANASASVAADDRRADRTERDADRSRSAGRSPGRRWRWRSPSRCARRPCCSPASRRAAAA